MGLKGFSGLDIEVWRKSHFSKDGKKAELDWLLEFGGGLRSNDLKKITLYPQKNFQLERTLKELTDIWEFHISSKKPLQQIIGKCPWRDFVLEINSDVLIPRPETELMIDIAIEKCGDFAEGTWADLGTGSGAIAIALAKTFPNWEGHAVDCSKRAIALAKKNINRLFPKAEVRFYCGNWCEPLSEYKNSFGLVLANPPYIPKGVLNNLDPIVKNYEPYVALCGGDDGLDDCRELVSGAIDLLSSGGWLIFEHHFDQSDKAMKLLVDFGYQSVSFKKDLNGIKRFAMGRRF